MRILKSNGLILLFRLYGPLLFVKFTPIITQKDLTIKKTMFGRVTHPNLSIFFSNIRNVLNETESDVSRWENGVEQQPRTSRVPVFYTKYPKCGACIQKGSV